MQVLLLSLGLGALPKFLAKGSKVGFIPTAGETYEDPSFVRDDRVRLSRLGYEIEDLDVTHTHLRELEATVARVDALFVAGGNTFYLLQQLRRAGLETAIARHVAANKLYVGASAGAVVVGPTLDPVRTLDDPQDAPELKDTTALGIVEFVVLPHFGKEKYLPKYQAIIKEFGQSLDLVTLRDDQAIFATGPNTRELIDSALLLHPL